ncbi:hypothetical protein N7456_003780 [Penicillium angulare]|uniref:UbiA prenyltransferase n=1 Tax=Penicillium angulare TaxID=116970 RepID=A0A9W9FW52_9EURO|nr:hypothetical protein N7456_003780 [Penicillium angulare]
MLPPKPHHNAPIFVRLSAEKVDKYMRQFFFNSIHLIHSIWLFTYSDLKTIIANSVGFGLFTSLGIGAFGVMPEPSLALIYQRLPLVLLWAWINLLPFTINNQRQPEAIMEDLINKPWRTMPSKRMNQGQAKLLMFFFYILAVCISSRIGGLDQCIALIGLGYWYNNAGGSDTSYIVRNLINSVGFLCFTSGALRVMLSSLEWQTFIDSHNGGLQWLGIIGGIIFTTVQLQDFYDQEGDSARGRKTLPLVIGNKVARYLTAALMVTWGFFTPIYWGGYNEGPGIGCLRGFGLYLALLASLISWRTIAFWSVKADKLSFLLWNIWLVSQYALPFFATLEFGRGGRA